MTSDVPALTVPSLNENDASDVPAEDNNAPSNGEALKSVRRRVLADLQSFGRKAFAEMPSGNWLMFMTFYMVVMVAMWALVGKELKQGLSRVIDHEASITSVMNLTIKPRDDSRNFQFATLANGIEVLTVQDSRALQKAFANAVESGSFDEPVKLPGLAHFCEHMLFLGTSKYKDPSGFDNFLAEHGGGSNAYTASESTVYYASVDQAGAKEALDRFADFFKTPLFAKAYVNKEVHAINSEHMKNTQNPGNQIIGVLHSLASPDSPLSRFHTGDIETLMTDPKKANIDPVEALKVYWKTHYCPDRMKIVTVGSETNAQQLELIAEEFGELTANSEACNAKRAKWNAPNPWPQDRMQKWVNIQGMLPQPALWLQFWLPDTSDSYSSAPLDYINYVLSYTGEGSLHRILTDSLGLATSMEVSFDGNSAGTGMYFIFKLTSEGRKNTELLMEVIFAYIAVLNRDGVNDNLYDSLARVGKLAWDWGGQAGPSDTVESLAGLMTTVKPEDLLWADSIIKNPDPEMVRSLMKQITPSNMVVAFVNGAISKTATKDKFFEGQKVQTLAHYGVNFSVQDLKTVVKLETTARWTKWLNGEASMATAEKVIKDIIKERQIKVVPNSPLVPKSPGQIVGIPQVLQVKHMYATVPALSDTQTIEALLFGPAPARLDLNGATASPYGKDAEFWYRSGWMIRSPKVMLSMILRPLRTPDEAGSTALQDIQLGMYGRLLSKQIAPKLVDITNTGVSYKIEVGPGGIEFQFVGFAPSMPMLIKKVLAEFNAFNADPELTPQVRWDRLRHQFREDMKTFADLPIKYALGDSHGILLKNSKSRAQLLEALDDDEASLRSSAMSVSNLLLSRQLQLTSLAMGNMGEDEARAMIGDFVQRIEAPKNVVMSHSVDDKVHRTTPVVNIKNPVEVRKLNPRLGDENDVAIVSILAGPATVESRVTLGLISSILKTAAYDELRTQETLGYIADGGETTISNVQALSAMVQGSSKDADEMAASIHYVFSVVMPKRFRDMTDAQFKDIKASLRHEIVQPPVTDTSEFSHFAGSIDQGGVGFELMNEMLKYLDGPAVTKESLSKEWDRIVLQEEGQRKVVTVKYFAKEASLEPLTMERSKEIWAKHKVSPKAAALLEREFKVTEHLTKVDSETVDKLASEGGYFSTKPNMKLKDTTVVAKGPLQVPQQIKDIIAQRKEEIDAFVDTPIVYGNKVAESSLMADSGDTNRFMRNKVAYSMGPRATFSLAPDA